MSYLATNLDARNWSCLGDEKYIFLVLTLQLLVLTFFLLLTESSFLVFVYLYFSTYLATGGDARNWSCLEDEKYFSTVLEGAATASAILGFPASFCSR